MEKGIHHMKSLLDWTMIFTSPSARVLNVTRQNAQAMLHSWIQTCNACRVGFDESEDYREHLITHHLGKILPTLTSEELEKIVGPVELRRTAKPAELEKNAKPAKTMALTGRRTLPASHAQPRSNNHVLEPLSKKRPQTTSAPAPLPTPASPHVSIAVPKVEPTLAEDEHNILASLQGDASEFLRPPGTTEWVIDSGATVHIACHVSMFTSINPLPAPVSFSAVGKGFYADYQGTVDVVLADMTTLTLHDVYWVPRMSCNLLSTVRLVQYGYTFMQDEDYCCFVNNKTDACVWHGTRHWDLTYRLDVAPLQDRGLLALGGVVGLD